MVLLKHALLKTLRWLSRFAPERIVRFGDVPFVACYHTVDDEAPHHIRHLYTPKTTKEFRSDLEQILRIFRPVSGKDIVDFIHSVRCLPENAILITVDDGLRECRDVIAPMLCHYGIPAVFFVCPGFLNNRAMPHPFKASLIVDRIVQDKSGSASKSAKHILFRYGKLADRPEDAILRLRYNEHCILDEIAEEVGVDFVSYLKKYRPFLSIDDVRWLKAQGHEIGAHSIDHPKYADIPFEEQIRQTQLSVEFVEREFHPTVRLFAFPFSQWGVEPKFFAWAIGPARLDALFGTGSIATDLPHGLLNRCSMERGMVSAAVRIRQAWLEYLISKRGLNRRTTGRR